MENDRRSEILGILIIALSVFILVSLLGYNSSEEPSISPNIQLDNPMGILGLITSYLLIKKGFGYVTILLPMIGFAWGWFLFSKKRLDKLIRTSAHLMLLMVLLSLSIAVGSILILDQSPNRYYLSGQIGGNLGDFFLDWLKIWGTIILLITSYLILIRSYFNFDFYAPIQRIFTQWDERKKRIAIDKDQRNKEEAKRRHTQELKEKIDSRKREEYYQEKVINEEIEPANSTKPDEELESNKPDQKELEKIDKEKYIDEIPKADEVHNLDEEADLDNLIPGSGLPKNKDLHI